VLAGITGKGIPPADITASVFATVSQWEDFRRFRSLCEAIGFKPPDGASEAEAAAWWLCLLESPQDYYEKLWRLFADYIRKAQQIFDEIQKRDREREAQLTEWAKRSNVDPRWLRAEFPSLFLEWVKSKNVTIARQQAEIHKLQDRTKSLAQRVRPRRQPTELEDKIATFFENANLTQTGAAKAIGRRMKKRISQSTVSRALKIVNLWRGANPTLGLPQIDTKKGAAKVARSVDPHVIELGARTDHLTERQRQRREDDDSDG
jgi:hypothetical protein